MAYGNNTLYPSLPLWGNQIACSMPSTFKLNAGEKNTQAGQYKAGDTIISIASYDYSYNGYYKRNECSTQTVRVHIRTSISANDGAIALLLIPCNLFTTNTAYEDLEKQCINARYNQIPYPYTVWMIRNNSTVATTNKAYKRSVNLETEDGKNASGYPLIQEGDNFSGGAFSGLTNFDDAATSWLLDTRTIDGEPYYNYPPEITLPITTQITNLKAKYDDYNSVLASKLVSTLDRRIISGYTFTNSVQIESSLPIFMYTQIEELYNYFKFGDTSGAENDLKISDVDFATDWKIYVNGQRKPNIYVTMESPDIESYLNNSAENKGGYSKEDFKIQYRVPTYTIKDGWTYRIESTGIVEESTDTYNNTRSSSWSEITDENYDLKVFTIGSIDSAQNLPLAYSMYAQLQFRVYLNDNLFSAWCEFGIGYIGSPSVPDFSEMQNWGNVVSINDGSTIEIIYDQLPDDVDDYEEPDDDFPPDGDTAPTGYSLDSALTTTYRVTLDQLQLLGQYLWGASFFDDIKLINNSPIENIVSCKKLPVNIPAGVARNIVLGNVTCPANGNVITNIPIIDVGTITYNGYYKNFLDYAPYTQLILFLPFCGFVNIDASAVTGKTLNIKYAIDVILGKCKAMVFLDGAYYMSVDGDLGIDIPLVASNRAQAESAFALQGIEAVAQGDLMGVLGAAVSTQYHSSRNGSYTPTVAWQETRKCFLIADIPTVQYPSSYGHDVGYPCMLTRTLATMSGFTVCSEDIDMSGFNCTSEEMDMIKQILTTGIYL